MLTNWRTGVLAGILPLAALALLPGCPLFNTTDSEGGMGRGATAFDPYAGPASGSIRIALQFINGCPVDGSGAPLGPGSAPIPHPEDCVRAPQLGPGPEPQPMTLVTGMAYFLNQFTFVDLVKNLHTDGNRLEEVTEWMRSESRLRGLDWSGLALTSDEWGPSHESLAPGYYRRRVLFGNPAWFNVKDDSFLVEVMDSDGVARSRAIYPRSDFISSGATSGHTKMLWELENVGAPTSPYDNQPTLPPPSALGFPPPHYKIARSMVRLEFNGNAKPFNFFRVDSSLRGDGAIRITWSQLPNEPMHFPVRFTAPDELPLSCYSDDGKTRVRCAHGVTPKVALSPPENGEFYQGGERVYVRLAMRDGKGNLLHHPLRLPSWRETVTGGANGILTYNFYQLNDLFEKDTISALKVMGPRHAFRMYYSVGGSPYFQNSTDQFVPESSYGNEGGEHLIPAVIAAQDLPGGAEDLHVPSTFIIDLPKDAQPGTYDVILKVHRADMAERFTKTEVFPVQVGQVEPTGYPQRIGGCQSCHRGTLSLENLRHGMGNDNVEACGGCHNRDVFPGHRNSPTWNVHAMHMESTRYTLPKNDCRYCHLTQESTVRTSIMACGSCHPQPHKSMSWPLRIAHDSDARNTNNVYGNCGGGCHDLVSLSLTHNLPEDAL